MKYNWHENLFPTTACCSISISKTITQKEWEKVYEEMLSLAKVLDLCTVKDFNYHGVTGKWFERSKEIKDNHSCSHYYWKPEGLYSERVAVATLKINRYLNEDDCGQSEGSAFLGYAYSDENLSSIMLGEEIEVPNYITSILALAFLVEARLPDKAFVYGDFDYKLALEAVEKINKHLKKAIGLPVVCRSEALMTLVKETNFSEEEKLKLFVNTYMGPANEDNEQIIQCNSESDNSVKLYDIECTKELFNYKKGNSISPELLKLLQEHFATFAEARKQNGYRFLSTLSPREQIIGLSQQINILPLCDSDWKHIINQFNKHHNSLERYYPLFMVRYDLYSSSSNVVRALLINDELYEFCKTFSE